MIYWKGLNFVLLFYVGSTVESRYVNLGLLEISVMSKFFWSPVLNLVLFNLIYFSYLKFRYVDISGISK